MGVLGADRAAPDRTRAAGIDRDLRSTGQFQNGAGVAFGRHKRCIAGDRSKPEQV